MPKQNLSKLLMKYKNFSTYIVWFISNCTYSKIGELLDLIVDSGYSVSTYFKYSLLNLFGITPKFIPLSFMLSLTIFI